jgi:signal transduction histidine kinase
MNTLLPIPANEMDRLKTLAGLDLDYTALADNLRSLSKLAAKIAGTDVSMVNLLDSYTQWTISSHGMNVEQMDREESICQYTIMEQDHLEVDLMADNRFKDKFYVTGDLQLRYYYGVPLRAGNGCHLGALCVLDKQLRVLSPEKEEMLQIIAEEIVNRLEALKLVESLRRQVGEVSESQRRIAHDIRGPVGGIIGLARIVSEQGDDNTMNEVLQFINLIQKSGHSILELADEILSVDRPFTIKEAKLDSDEFNQIVLKEKLLKLYMPQAINKKLQAVPFLKNKLLQVIGNLISNAMKFTPAGGKVTVHLDLDILALGTVLQIKVEDNGVGMCSDKKAQILHGKGDTTIGTEGEKGYGFGLSLVKHLVDSLKGTMQITSEQGSGTSFVINIPQHLGKKALAQ